jgi:cell division protein FtsI/penicillin-binding protein 2
MDYRSAWVRVRRAVTGTDDARDGGVVLRMAFVTGLILGGFVWVSAQAGWYQFDEAGVRDARDLSAMTGSEEVQGRRGEIRDRTGRRVLAMTVPDPEVVYFGASWDVDRIELSYTLASALHLDPGEVLSSVVTAGEFARIKSHATPEEVQALKVMDVDGVRIDMKPRRFYPNGDSLGPVIGFVSQANPAEEARGVRFLGRMGVEGKYDQELRGEVRDVALLRSKGREGFYKDALGIAWELDGNDLVLNVDAQMQAVLDGELMAQMEAEDAPAAMGVILDARTFEVLAMSSLPAMDPNNFETACKPDPKHAAELGLPELLLNPCANKVVGYPFEPGSIGKIVTIATAIDDGTATPDTILDGHGGQCPLGGRWVKDVHAVGRLPLSDAFKFSSNCAHLDLAMMMGPEKMFEGLKRFRVGRTTGIDLPGEVGSAFQGADDWRKTGFRTAGFGYGYTATLLEMANVVATITNDGQRIPPRVARELRSVEGAVVRTFDAAEPIRVISAEAARQVRDVMRLVVMDDRGTGKRGRPVGYSAAGKTGTARLLVPGQGYSEDKYLCSFVGYAPAENPRIVVALTMVNPRVHKLAGAVAAPVFKNVVERSLPILGVMPVVPAALTQMAER